MQWRPVPMAWKPLMEHDRAGVLMTPLFLLNGDMEIDDAADENELVAQASDMIPTCIAGIHEFWRTYQKSSHRPRPQQVRRSQTPVTRQSASTASRVDQVGREHSAGLVPDNARMLHCRLEPADGSLIAPDLRIRFDWAAFEGG